MRRSRGAAGGADKPCAHRCKDKANCSHACCKRGLPVSVADVPAAADEPELDSDDDNALQRESSTHSTGSNASVKSTASSHGAAGAAGGSGAASNGVVSTAGSSRGSRRSSAGAAGLEPDSDADVFGAAAAAAPGRAGAASVSPGPVPGASSAAVVAGAISGLVSGVAARFTPPKPQPRHALSPSTGGGSSASAGGGDSAHPSPSASPYHSPSRTPASARGDRPPKLSSPSKSLPIQLPSSTTPPRSGRSSARESGVGLGWPSRDPSPITPRTVGGLSQTSDDSFTSSAASDASSSFEAERQRRAAEERAARDEQRNRERREEEKRIRAAIEADRQRALAAKQQRAAAAAAAAAAQASAQVQPLPALASAVAPSPAAEAAARLLAHARDLHRDDDGPVAVTPRARPEPSAAGGAHSGLWTLPRVLLLLSALLAVAAATAYVALPAASWARLLSQLSALPAAVVHTFSGSSCATNAPHHTLATFQTLTQPNFGASAFALSQTQPLAVRRALQGLHMSLASGPDSDATASAAGAKPNGSGGSSSGQPAATAAAAAPAAAPTEAELAKRTARSRDGITVLHFAGSAARDQQRLLDAITASAFVRGANSGAVLQLRGDAWHTQLKRAAELITNSADLSDKHERRDAAVHMQARGFQRVLHAHLCACDRVLIAIHDAHLLPPRVTQVLESVLDAQSLELPCDAVDVARGADALSAMVLAEPLTAPSALLSVTGAADAAATAGSSAAAESTSTRRDVDLSGSLMVLLTDLAAADAKPLSSAALDAAAASRLDSAVQEASNKHWPRKAFVGRITLTVPFVGLGTTTGTGTVPPPKPAPADAGQW